MASNAGVRLERQHPVEPSMGTRLLAGAKLWGAVYRGRTRVTPLRAWLPDEAGGRSLASSMRAVDY